MAWVEMFQKDQMDMTPEEWRDFWNIVQARELRTIKSICESIGYGRVHQYVEELVEEKMPGWLNIRDERIRAGEKVR